MKIKFILIFIIFYCLNQSQITIADSNVFTVEDCLNDEENTNNNNQPKNVIDCVSINSELSNCTCADDYIDCSKRNFKSIPTNLTQLPAQIKRLLFANNRIKSLFALDFGNKSSIKITVINLKKNLIDYVDPDFFSTANIYESLNVLSFCGNSNLTSLNNLNSSVSFNKLETLEINNLRAAFEINDNFFIKQRFPALTKLDLNNVSLIYKKQPFTNLDKLQSLRLDSNDLKQMPCQSISQMTRLGVLNLNFNKIKQTSNVVCLKNLNSLNQLHLSSNSLTNSDIEMIDFPPNLEVLDLSNNLIDNFPDKLLRKVKNLNFLRIKIKQDKFMSINQEEEAAAWPYMTHLDLTDSVIYKLPEKAFVNLSLIISDLILKNCHLNEIHPDAFFGLSSLFGLDLSNNNLRNLEKPSSKGQFDYNMLKGNLKLDKNKLACEQLDVEWFIQFYDYPLFDKKLTCIIKNNSFINTYDYLQAHRVHPQTNKFNVLTIMLLILIVLVVATTVVYFLRRNHVKQRQQQYRYRYFTERSQDDGFDTDNVPVYRDCTVSLKIKDTDDMASNNLDTSSTAALTNRDI